MAMEEMQKAAVAKGLDRWPEKWIADEIKAVRKARRA